MSLLILLSYFSISQVAGEGVRFTYDSPGDWPTEFPQCGGDHQSPIDFSHSMATERGTPPLVFTNYDVPFKANIENNGHTVMVTVSQAPGNLTVTGGSLCSVDYEFVELHAHWDSEHTFEGVAQVLEVHIVHKRAIYETIGDALQNDLGVAVFGIVFGTDPSYPKNSGIAQLAGLLENVGTSKSSFEQDGFILNSFFENVDLGRFYTYMGSLTTPPCTEGIIWTVFDKIVSIDKDTLAQFYNLHDNENNLICHNNRPVQKSENLFVYYRNADNDKCWY